jgi:HEAT repeat protein
LERAAVEESLQRALRRRFEARGWTSRTFERLEGLWREDRAEAVAVALEAGPDGETKLRQELEMMRKDKGRAAVVLDELSRFRDRRVRAWVPGAAADVLGDGAVRLILSLARDRDAEVRDAAVSALIGLGPMAVRPVLPDLRRRLHSKAAAERIAAMQKLAAAGDESVLPLLEERVATAALPEERDAARAATIALRPGGARSDDVP